MVLQAIERSTNQIFGQKTNKQTGDDDTNDSKKAKREGGREREVLMEIKYLG